MTTNERRQSTFTTTRGRALSVPLGLAEKNPPQHKVNRGASEPRKTQMYSVTFRGSPIDNSPYAVDDISGGLEDALAHASQLIAEGKLEVSIEDGSGKKITGDILSACCRGDKKISDALFVT